MHFWLDRMVFASHIATIPILVTVFMFHSERILKQLEEEQQSRRSAEEKLKELEGQYKLLFRIHCALKKRPDQKWNAKAFKAIQAEVLQIITPRMVLEHAPGTIWNVWPKKSHLEGHVEHFEDKDAVVT